MEEEIDHIHLKSDLTRMKENSRTKMKKRKDLGLEEEVITEDKANMASMDNIEDQEFKPMNQRMSKCKLSPECQSKAVSPRNLADITKDSEMMRSSRVVQDKEDMESTEDTTRSLMDAVAAQSSSFSRSFLLEFISCASRPSSTIRSTSLSLLERRSSLHASGADVTARSMLLPLRLNNSHNKSL
jgi:hypothetical protein